MLCSQQFRFGSEEVLSLIHIFEPDQEHVKDDADLRDYIESRPHRSREKISFRARREAPKQRRTEHDPRENFADHLWLTNAAEDLSLIHI